MQTIHSYLVPKRIKELTQRKNKFSKNTKLANNNEHIVNKKSKKKKKAYIFQSSTQKQN